RARRRRRAALRRPRARRGLARGPARGRRRRPVPHGVQAPAVHHAQRGARAVQGADPRPRVAVRLGRRREHRRVLHLLPTSQDRQPHGARARRRARRAPAAHPHQAGRGLPAAPAADDLMTSGPDRTTTGSRPVPPPPPPPPGPTTPAEPAPHTSGAPGAGAPLSPGAGPTAERPFGRPVPTEGWGWFARVPLRARLVAITVLLLAAGLGLASVVTTTVVSSYLVRQVDVQRERSAAAVANITPNERIGSGSQLPRDYYVLVPPPCGDEVPLRWPQTVNLYGVPNIPAMSDPEVEASQDEPFTVDSVGGTDPAEWRVTTFFFYDKFSGELGGTAFVALPLTGIHETVKVLGRALALSALGIALVGGAVAYLAVHRALRPLREIEETAADIAAGDLSRRVRPAPPTTEVGSLAASLNAMLSQIEEAFAVQEASEERMRRFVSDASHELRTPLATIRGYGELYRMGALDTPDKVDDTMGRIEDSATRMGTLVND